MKNILLTLVITLTTYHSYAQTNIYESGGNVGIGTSSPNEKLDVVGNISLSGGTKEIQFRDAGNFIRQFVWLHSSNSLGLGKGGETSSMFISPTGSVGIGTVNPTAKLDVIGPANFSSAAGNYTLSVGGSGNDYGSIGYNQQYGSTSGVYNYKITDYASMLKFFLGGFDFMTAASGAPGTTIPFVSAMRITQDGKVGIGTTTPKEALSVNGNIRSRQIKVEEQNWPDYVFKPSYNLPSLADVKKYIDKNQRLPDMPSEQEVSKNGLNLGELVKIQTQKIEELTLYLIEKDKQVRDLQDEMKQLKMQQRMDQTQQEEINHLKEEISRIIKN